MRLTFYGGIEGEVGGNIISVESEDTRIFLDMGINFQKRKKYFDDIFLRPSSTKELESLGILPLLDIFHQEARIHCDGILISHAHSDHYKFISLVNRSIPIFLSEETAKIINAIYQTLTPSFENNYKNLKFESISESKKIKIGEIEVFPLKVDHSIIGALAFLLFTPECTLLYTGDFRTHGLRRNLTEKLIEICKEEKIDVLITEATRCTDFSYTEEKEIKEKLDLVIKHVKNLAIIDISLLDLDRISSIVHAAIGSGRKIVVPPRLMFYLLSLQKYLTFSLEDFFLYQERKAYKHEWETETLSALSDKLITPEKISFEPEKYIFINTFYSPAELKEIRPPPGSLYILSTSEPIDEERELSFDRLINWLEFFGLPLLQLHSSGHVDILSLHKLVKEVKPKVVFPIHTPNPILVGKSLSAFAKVILPKKEIPYTFP